VLFLPTGTPTGDAVTIDQTIGFPGISAKAYEHPADRAATAALHAIPLLDGLLKRLSELGLERRYRQLLLGNAVRLGPEQMPAVWGLHCSAASVLDLEPPPLYVTQSPMVNAMTVGTNSPVVMIYSSLVGSYEPVEVHAVLAHELGHVLSEHTYYNTVLAILAQVLQGVLSTSLLVGLPVRALYYALLEWSRAAELSSDRASAIVLADPIAACGMLMRTAGGALPGMNVQAFLRQATEYTEEDDLFARHARFGTELSQTHPFAVRRVKELVTWVGSGEYDRIITGTYVHKGEEPPVSDEFDAAVAHYRARFTSLIERTGGGLTKLSGQIQSWLRGHRTTDGDQTDDTEDSRGAD
jgi:Zn-dependent protease with chaperone function